MRRFQENGDASRLLSLAVSSACTRSRSLDDRGDTILVLFGNDGRRPLGDPGYSSPFGLRVEDNRLRD